MGLHELLPGKTGYIEKIYGDEKLVKRLMALGCLEGTKVSLTRVAPLGDPIVLNIRGCNLAIRKKDAMNIVIKEVV